MPEESKPNIPAILAVIAVIGVVGYVATRPTDPCGDKPCDPPPPVPCSKVQVTVTADPTKPNGKAWDLDGSAPDIAMKIGRHWASPCKNTFICERTKGMSGTSVRIEIWDKEPSAFGKGPKPDKIGIGTVSVPGTERVGAAEVTTVCVE